MNPLEEMLDILEGNGIQAGEIAAVHYGTKRHSGRYPWGSGETPYQHERDFMSRVDSYADKGYSEKEIAKFMGISTTALRVQYSYANSVRRQSLYEEAKKLSDEGKNATEIARIMDLPGESSVRSLLNEQSAIRMQKARATADALKEAVDKAGGKFVDIGPGVERELNVSREKLDQAVYILGLEGYQKYTVRYPQPTNPGQMTSVTILCPPGTEKLVKEGKKASSEMYDPNNIVSFKDYAITYDGGDSYHKPFEYPSSLDSKRLMIRYAEEGGINKDGVIEIRRGVKDLDLGPGQHYSQVRILVDGDRYLKGMAVYADDLPDGVDVRFNTNKHVGTDMRDVLKKIHIEDPKNPFGSLIKEHGGQSYYEDENGKYLNPTTGKKESLSLINKRAEEGDWGEWSKKLPSQFLAKQPIKLIKQQLGLSISDKQEEYDEIVTLTNPTVKKKLLMSFADDCDSAAVHLKAAALPRQSYQVILPLESISDKQVYAPNYKDGETVALIRFPHAGTFEIPILTVNNKNKEGNSTITKNAKDAVGISKAVADRLSGADFDGDTVLVIPVNEKSSINSTHPLKGLKDFDPKESYGTVEKDDGYYNSAGKKIKVLGETQKQKQMGVVSNLITDMTILGATESEMARAVRHSMVVIDATKHHLDYKQSEIDNGIADLKAKYQGHYEDGRYKEGASTLLSRAKSQTSVLKTQGSAQIDPETGKKYYKTSDRAVYTDYKTGKTKTRTQQSTKMAETDDAYTLVSESKNQVELLYAEYANAMKSLGNQARKEYLNTGNLEYKPEARKKYSAEVDSLNTKLTNAELNAPRERRAIILANSRIKEIVAENPDLTDSQHKSELKKIRNQAVVDARVAVGSKRTPIDISDKEWEAIQAGAVSNETLKKILDNTDVDAVKERATPRKYKTELSTAKQALIKSMASSGFSNADIAQRLGVSATTVSKYLV